MNAPLLRFQRSSRPVRVLLVDECTSLRRMIRLMLERAGGFEVLEAESADGARAALSDASSRPDVVLVELDLADSMASSLVQWVRQIPALQTIPIALTGGRPLDEGGPFIHRVGADAYLAKPFTLARLTSVVRSLAGRGGAVEDTKGVVYLRRAK